MSAKSMTGFGRGEATNGTATITVELSSVNRKGIDFSIAYPQELSLLQPEAETELKKYLQRGSIKGKIYLKQESDNGKFSINLGLAKTAKESLQELTNILEITEPITLSTILRIPGILESSDTPQDLTTIRPLLIEAIDKAAESLVKMRQIEGDALTRDLIFRISTLAKIRDEIAKLAQNAPQEYKQKLEKRVQELANDPTFPQDLIAREIVLFADRTDIQEELTRLQSHLQQAQNLLTLTEPIGRRLDFISQELLREINTTGSKSQEIRILDLVVEFKSLLETFREQIQNLE